MGDEELAEYNVSHTPKTPAKRFYGA